MKSLALAGPLLLLAGAAFAQATGEHERSESRAAMARALEAEPGEAVEPGDGGQAAAAPEAEEKFPPLRIYRISATSKGQTGAVGKLPQIAAVLNETKARCVDLASLGLARGGSPYRESETYGVLMHGKLSKEQRESISQAICPGRSCSVKFKAVKIKPRETAVLADPFQGQQPQSQLLALVKSALPRFSQSCADGSNTWKDTASTPEAKQWLKDAGIDVEKARRLELVGKTKSGGGSHLWIFGVPKNACNSGGGCQ